MGNSPSSSSSSPPGEHASFPGSALVDALQLQCGTLDDTATTADYDNNKNGGGSGRRRHHRRSNSHTHHKNNPVSSFLARTTDEFCSMSPTGSEVGVGGGNPRGGTWNNHHSDFDDEYEEFGAPSAPTRTADNKNNNNGNASQDDVGAAGAALDPVHSNANHETTTTTSSALFAKALVSEVTDNPKTMTPQAMAEREKKLLKAQEKARQLNKHGNNNNSGGSDGLRAVGSPGVGIGKPNLIGSLAHALRSANSHYSLDHPPPPSTTPSSARHNPSVIPPNSLSENRAVAQAAGFGGGVTTASSLSSSSMAAAGGALGAAALGKYTVTIGLSLSRRSSPGHLDTVTRQTAFDFNELQDREYKYVSSTDASGWRAGGGERGGPSSIPSSSSSSIVGGSGGGGDNGVLPMQHEHQHPGTPLNHAQDSYKLAAVDTVHIPIIHIDAGSPEAVDAIISALARGEVFIPHMAIIPEALSVNGVSPPDLVVRFGTERNDDLPPDEWPNWCLEFMHNQLYEYFHTMGARWMKRPFSITLAQKVRWKTVKHMNRYFAHAERVIDAWREKGPQYLDPQLAYIEGGATPEEVARPHGIYLLRNGVPTNYFAPNFDPPYTTKMTRSLLLNVLGKSWDKKRREWSSEPIPRLVTPSMLVTAMCGCSESQAGGFVATEATTTQQTYGYGNNAAVETSLPEGSFIRSYEEDTLVVATQMDKREQQQLLQQQQYQQHLQMDQAEQQRLPQILVEQQQYNKDHSADGVASTNPSPTAADLRNLSSASGIPSPNQHQQQLRNSEYTEERMMAKVDEESNPARQREPPETHVGNIMQKMNLHLNTSSDDESNVASSTHASKSAISIASSKYGRPPTPEYLLSPRSAMTPTNEDVMDDENANPTDPAAVSTTTSPVDPPTDDVAFTGVAATSDVVQPSVAGTNTTILHMNLSTEKYMKREMERRRDAAAAAAAGDEKKEGNLVSDEDWLDELGEPLATVRSTKPAASHAKPTYSMKREKVKQALDRERQRQIELIAMVQEQTSGKTPSQIQNALKDPEKMKLAEAVIMEESKRSPSLRMNHSGTSGISLDYSIDSAGNTIGESTVGSSLLGQNIDTATVMSSSTRGTKGAELIREVLREGSRSAEESQESSFLSMQDSEELVPTDEELFKVGWAKALDANSGSYYYFTLDRSKTVWDNPLAPPSQSAEESMDDDDDDDNEEEELPEGAAVI